MTIVASDVIFVEHMAYVSRIPWKCMQPCSAETARQLVQEGNKRLAQIR